jgi:hypothetical protein
MEDGDESLESLLPEGSKNAFVFKLILRVENYKN